MVKNPTPQQIAIITSILTLAGFALALGIFTLPLPNVNPWLRYSLIFLLAFFVAYYINIFFLKRYIYRKIKLVYKTIHQEKLAPEEKKQTIDITRDIMEDMEKEVTAWAETQRKEIAKYKTWAEYRRNFVGDISHELKTPIFNIQGYLETLEEGAMQDPELRKRFLSKAIKNVHRLETIVQDLETISRLESGNFILEMQSFDIKDLVAEVFEDMEMKAKSKHISLLFKEGASNGFKVRADREKVRQVLINLIHNSIKYGKENGATKVGFYDMDRNVLIEVADNGVGIPKDHINHVFDRFYRVDKSRSRTQGGSGLGLSIVKHILEAHKQTINVRSTQNLGSTFGFTLAKA